MLHFIDSINLMRNPYFTVFLFFLNFDPQNTVITPVDLTNRRCGFLIAVGFVNNTVLNNLMKKMIIH